MGTRSGDVDPGLLLYLLRTRPDMTPDRLDALLNHESGLKGLAGWTPSPSPAASASTRRRCAGASWAASAWVVPTDEERQIARGD